MSLFFDDLVDRFYEKLGTDYRDPGSWRRGQVFLAPIPYVQEQKQYWRPVGYDTLTSTSATQFNAVGHASDLFRRKHPLYAPRLESNEEFIVTRAKIRPVVLFASPLGRVASSLRHHHLVIPRFGLVKTGGIAKFSQELVDRVRSLEFPEVMFTPGGDSPLDQDGILRLDLLQPIPKSHLEPTPMVLGPQALLVLEGMYQHAFFNRYEGDYADWREMLLHP